MPNTFWCQNYENITHLCSLLCGYLRQFSLFSFSLLSSSWNTEVHPNFIAAVSAFYESRTFPLCYMLISWYLKNIYAYNNWNNETPSKNNSSELLCWIFMIRLKTFSPVKIFTVSSSELKQKTNQFRSLVAIDSFHFRLFQRP